MFNVIQNVKSDHSTGLRPCFGRRLVFVQMAGRYCRIFMAVLFFAILLSAGERCSAADSPFPQSALEKALKGNEQALKIYHSKHDGDKKGNGSAVSVAWNDNYSEKDLRYMSSIMYCEANSMTFDAKVAVANVIINRKNNNDDWSHCNTIKDVIYDNKWGVQFSPTNGSPSLLDNALGIYDNLEDYKGNWKYDCMTDCIKASKAAFCGVESIPSNYYYFNGYVTSSKERCESSGKSYLIIDGHIYF